MCVSFLRRVVILVLLCIVQFALPSVATADEVLDWNTIAVREMQRNTAAPPAASNAVPAFLQGRFLAIVHVSIFDALNGFDRRYEAVHFDMRAPRRASRRAAVVGAAYTALVKLLALEGALDALKQAQLDALTADRDASLEAIDHESDGSIQRGYNWGVEVGNAIFAWCATDGLNPQIPDPGHPGVVGMWRPTPRPNPAGGELPGLPGAGLTMASMRPFVIPSPSYFRPAGPPPLASEEYAESVNEVKSVGELGSLTRSADQTQSARFWAGGGVAAVWNRAAASASRQRRLKLSENARLFALFNMTVADSAISAWDSKYYFDLWRPITAIREDGDGNPRTVAQAGWVPLIVTPPYPEYYSGHQSASGAAEEFLTALFGNRMRMESYAEGLPGVIRSWTNFSAAADDAFMARIWAGIHFRFAMEDTRKASEKIARYVLEHGIRPRHDDHEDRDDKHEDKDKHKHKDKREGKEHDEDE